MCLNIETCDRSNKCVEIIINYKKINEKFLRSEDNKNPCKNAVLSLSPVCHFSEIVFFFPSSMLDRW